MDAEEQRKVEEAEFHDRRERARRELSADEFAAAYPNSKYYSIARIEQRFLRELVDRLPKGAVVLDYCSGPGAMALQLAKMGVQVHGIDISAESVQTATDLLAAHGVGHLGTFEVMDAENLSFPDASFDMIVCSGVLHHLDVRKAYPQLARVLKPGGTVYCIEALGYNPAIQAYRRLTPRLRTAWEVEHIITLREIDQAREFFEEVDVHYLYLLSLLAVPFRRSRLFKPLLATLERLDAALLRVPGLQLMAWQTIFLLRKPKGRR